MKDLLLIIGLSAVLVVGFWAGHSKGFQDGKEEQAEITTEWQYTAKHYGGICKWLLENKPIAGPPLIEPNCTLSNCLFIYDGNIDVSGDGITLIGGEFRQCNMDWLESIPTVDPEDAICNICGISLEGVAGHCHW